MVCQGFDFFFSFCGMSGGFDSFSVFVVCQGVSTSFSVFVVSGGFESFSVFVVSVFVVCPGFRRLFQFLWYV